jgi:hypothetical protein
VVEAVVEAERQLPVQALALAPAPAPAAQPAPASTPPASTLPASTLPASTLPASTLPALEQLAATAAAEQLEASALVVRTRHRDQPVQALRAKGKAIKQIGRETGLARGTVRRFVRAASVEELLAKPRAGRPSILDPFKAYLHQRWNDSQGRCSAAQLDRDLCQQGYTGSQATVADYLRPFRGLGAVPPATSAAPKSRQIASWLLCHPDSLDADKQLARKEVLARCRHLEALAGHVTAFAGLMATRHGDRLDDWIAEVEADELPALRSFAAGLRRDYDAVRNGLTLPFNSGAVEGTVNRIKMLKRQTYGRANLDLLRKRVLLRA